MFPLPLNCHFYVYRGGCIERYAYHWCSTLCDNLPPPPPHTHTLTESVGGGCSGQECWETTWKSRCSVPTHRRLVCTIACVPINQCSSPLVPTKPNNSIPVHDCNLYIITQYLIHKSFDVYVCPDHGMLAPLTSPLERVLGLCTTLTCGTSWFHRKQLSKSSLQEAAVSVFCCQ